MNTGTLSRECQGQIIVYIPQWNFMNHSIFTYIIIFYVSVCLFLVYPIHLLLIYIYVITINIYYTSICNKQMVLNKFIAKCEIKVIIPRNARNMPTLMIVLWIRCRKLRRTLCLPLAARDFLLETPWRILIPNPNVYSHSL
jgi:hypothetical protein